MLKVISDTDAKKIIGGGRGDYKFGETCGRVVTTLFGGKIAGRAVRAIRHR